MVSPHQGCEQVLFVSPGKRGSPDSSGGPNVNRAAKRRAAALAVIAAALAFSPLHAMAREHGTAGNMHRMTEEDLSRVHARGLHDRYFDKMYRYLADGMAVEVLGNMGTLLNPLSMLLDAETTYKDVIFNPNSPWMVADSNGTAYLRLPQSVGEISFRNIRILGSRSASFGSVTIRDINFNGTTIKITKR